MKKQKKEKISFIWNKFATIKNVYQTSVMMTSWSSQKTIMTRKEKSLSSLSYWHLVALRIGYRLKEEGIPIFFGPNTSIRLDLVIRGLMYIQKFLKAEIFQIEYREASKSDKHKTCLGRNPIRVHTIIKQAYRNWSRNKLRPKNKSGRPYDRC